MRNAFSGYSANYSHYFQLQSLFQLNPNTAKLISGCRALACEFYETLSAESQALIH